MSLLTMVQQVCLRVGIPSPSSVAGNTDSQITRVLALANEEGQEIQRTYPWQQITQESTFTTVATESQGAITTLAGSDFDYVLNETIWNRSLRRPVFGPLSAPQWQQLKAQQILGPWNQYRIRGGNVIFIPVPAAGQTCAFEWISKNWCQSSGGTGQAAWNADTDTGKIDETLMAFGVVWRWKQSLGFDYAEDFAKYERQKNDLQARDGAKQILDMGIPRYDVYPGVLVPSGNWMS